MLAPEAFPRHHGPEAAVTFAARIDDPAGADAGLRVAVAHEWLVTYAGSERCVEQLLTLYPHARLLTTVVERGALPSVFHRAEPSLLQRVPGAVRHYQKLIPAMPLSWALRRGLTDLDVVISSSHACAKRVNVAPGVAHVCYCHTPMRYAWEFALERSRFPRGLRAPASLAMRGFRRWDRGTGARVDRFVANSRDVAQRIRRAYGRESTVIHPPVDTRFFTPGGPRGDHFLYLGRLVGYKRPDLVVEAFQGLPHRLIVAGSGPMRARLEAAAPGNVAFAGRVGDDDLRDLLRSARALIFPAHEDFGIVMAEALACGTPVIALAAGGALDIVTPGENGWLIDEQRVGPLRRAIQEASRMDPPTAEISLGAQRFGRERYRMEMDRVVRDTLAAPGRRW